MIGKKIGSEKESVKQLCLFTRSKVGTHLGLVLENGKSNSIIIGITHAESFAGNIKSVGADFSSISLYQKLNKYGNILKTDESRAILTIVDNKTIEYKNQKILHSLRYRTGLINVVEQERLKEKILFKNKLIHLSNNLEGKANDILYQTKTKTEVINIENSPRLIELIGVEMYEKHFKALSELSIEIGEEKLPIVNILKEKMEKEGVETILNIINKLI